VLCFRALGKLCIQAVSDCGWCEAGGVLSPCLFALFIDSIIFTLRRSGVGAFIGGHYVGCLLYADDIMLVCHSLTAMQTDARYLFPGGGFT